MDAESCNLLPMQEFQFWSFRAITTFLVIYQSIIWAAKWSPRYYTGSTWLMDDFVIWSYWYIFMTEIIRLPLNNVTQFDDFLLSVQVKEWAKAHNINDSKTGTLNSYSLSLLVVFHFQVTFCCISFSKAVFSLASLKYWIACVLL